MNAIDFSAIKSRVPLAEYCREQGCELNRDGANLKCLCPLHEEKTGSFTVYPDDHFCCYGCGANGDVIDLEQLLRGGTKPEAARRLAEAHGIVLPGITNSSSNVNSHRANQGPNGSHFDWQPLVNAVTDAHLSELSEWRGFSPEFCRSLRDRKLIGRHGDQWALPVHRDGEVVSAHRRVVKPDGDVKWIYHPSPGRAEPLVIGPLQQARIVHSFESQWDQFALADKLGLLTVTVSTRGPLDES